MVESFASGLVHHSQSYKQTSNGCNKTQSVLKKYESSSRKMCCTLLSSERQNGNNHSPLPLTSRAIESHFCGRRKNVEIMRQVLPKKVKPFGVKFIKLKEVTDEGFSTFFSKPLRKMARGIWWSDDNFFGRILISNWLGFFFFFLLLDYDEDEVFSYCSRALALANKQKFLKDNFLAGY